MTSASACTCRAPPGSLASGYSSSLTCDFAKWAPSGKVFFGHADGTLPASLATIATDNAVGSCTALGDCIGSVVKATTPAAVRKNGERFVPLLVWRTPSFQVGHAVASFVAERMGSNSDAQLWYSSVTRCGNRLDGAKTEWVVRSWAFLDPTSDSNVFTVSPRTRV